jgi:hypothetical protein
MAMDSAYDVCGRNRASDVVVNASYCGVLPARFIASHRPRGSIGVDCAVGPAGAGIAGLWYLEALNIPAAAADVRTVLLGDGVDLFENGVVSWANRPAGDCGVEPGMRVREAARRILAEDPLEPRAEEVTHRRVMHDSPLGGQIICIDSIAFGRPAEDHANVLLTAGHTGRSSVPYLRRVRPKGFICSDGGRGRDDSGIAGLYIVEEDGLAGATVDATTASMGDGLSTYRDGVISAVNALARLTGVREGMRAPDAALLLLDAPRPAPAALDERGVNP